MHAERSEGQRAVCGVHMRCTTGQLPHPSTLTVSCVMQLCTGLLLLLL